MGVLPSDAVECHIQDEILIKALDKVYFNNIYHHQSVLPAQDFPDCLSPSVCPVGWDCRIHR